MATHLIQETNQIFVVTDKTGIVGDRSNGIGNFLKSIPIDRRTLSQAGER
jgi:hypothetical protein